MDDLKQKTIRGASSRLLAQAATFLLRIFSMMVLARLLDPSDFGLVGMVTALTGILSLFRDFGLSAATVQRVNVTEAQMSTLFWLNLLVGGFLTALTLLCAPAVGAFYHEPRLVGVTCVVAASFLLNGAGVQHSALLQRQMRFTALAIIDFVSLVGSALVAIVAANAGLRYWSLALMTVSMPLVSTPCLWLVASWAPGRPRRHSGIRSLMRFGGTITLNGLVIYIGSNFEKVLLGRFWGADAIGIYGRAYNIIRIPTDSLNGAIGEVAFSALSRIQHDAQLLKRYFLKGYSLVLALTLPLTVACAMFADDIIRVLLGPKWAAAAPIFRLLAPTILAFAILNPLGWLMNSLGLVGRGLRIAIVLAPVMVAGYVIGLPHGPKGVAFAYSTVMVLAVLPLIAWAVRDTSITVLNILTTVARPLISVVIAGAIAYAARAVYGALSSSWLRLFVENAILFSIYVAVLLLIAGERSVYRDLLRRLRTRLAGEKLAI